MTDFPWMADVEMVGPCLEWHGDGWPPRQHVWRDLTGASLPRHMALQSRCRNKACVDPDHHFPQNKTALRRIAHARRWGKPLPEWSGSGCSHTRVCPATGCEVCDR